jgi:flavin reductase (DIM6/NTAB) family NADH-FMN oxidoreductase RutF
MSHPSPALSAAPGRPALDHVPAPGQASVPGQVSAIDTVTFRRALSRHPAGVAIVTLPGPAGLTVTSFSSASLDPPLVSFYIGHGSSNWPAVQAAAHFAVNLMGNDQEDVAARFARKGAERFGPRTRWEAGPRGLPLLSGATTHLICVRHALVTVGDHELVVGQVAQVLLGATVVPLLHHQGQFTHPQVAPA